MKIWFLLMLVFCSAAPTVFAQITSGEWTYALTHPGNATTGAAIVGYSGSGGEVVIPASIDGNPVTQLGYTRGVPGHLPVFRGKNATSISIPETLMIISSRELSFLQAEAILVAPANQAFSSVGGVLFNKQGTVILAYPKTKSGPYVVPDGVTEIGSFAFAFSSGLESVTIPATVTRVGSFHGCSALLSFFVSPDNPNYSSEDGVLFDKAKTTLLRYPQAKHGPYAIPHGVTTLVGFSGSAGLTSVSIAESVVTIDVEAFAGCTALADLSIPDGVESILEGAFAQCTALTDVSIGSGLAVLGNDVFGGCTALLSFVVSADNPRFSSQDGVLFDKDKTVVLRYPQNKQGPYTIPLSVTAVANFGGSAGLTRVVIPDSATSIVTAAFYDCANLESVSIGDNVATIGGEAFANCLSLGSVTIGSGLSILRDDVFYGCNNLQSVYFFGDAPSAPLGDGEEYSEPYEPFIFGGIDPVGIVYHLPDAAGWGATFSGWPTQTFLPPGPKLRVQQPVGWTMVSGSPANPLPASPVGETSSARTYTLRNSGGVVLRDLQISVSGEGAGRFLLNFPPINSLEPLDKLTFEVLFSPNAGGNSDAEIIITSSDTDNSPFIINLSGFGLAENVDTDGDGLSDAAEFAMSALGFDWQSSQPTLVASLYGNANRAQLFTQSQFDANRAAGRQDVMASPMVYGLYDRNSIMDLRMNGAMVQKHGDAATVVFQPQITTDLATEPFVDHGTPITNTIPMPGDKGFLRIQAR